MQAATRCSLSEQDIVFSICCSVQVHMYTPAAILMRPLDSQVQDIPLNMIVVATQNFRSVYLGSYCGNGNR
jgi:hypothetical protein